MLREFNLLITTTRGSEAEVCSEIWYLLGEIGDNSIYVDKTGISGLIVAKTTFQPHEAIRKLRKLLEERPYEFRYSLRIIPIQEVVQTDLDEITEKAAQLAVEIEENNSFRITVEKRHSDISRIDIIEAVAKDIHRKVDLKNPQKIILIEVVGGLTGISVINPKSIISTSKERFQTID
ncbi:THUMP domain-containing protein [Candidatus Bathyarchaeota archaeon]|nr:THUMP domain-containing protein [Candidatus Bathyarchaeota archaeon]